MDCGFARQAAMAWVVLLGLSSSVQADDWSGFYAGAIAGYGMGGNGVEFAPGSDPAKLYFEHELIPGLLPTTQSGFFGGAEAGFNRQEGAWVYGIEADIATTAISGSAAVQRINFGIAYDTTSDVRLDTLGTLRLRAGAALPGNTLAFVTGGAAYGHASLATTIDMSDDLGPYCGPSGVCGEAATSAWKIGWVVGAGVERQFTPSWTAKAEVLYYDLGTVSNRLSDPHTEFDIPFFDASAGFNGALFRVGVNYRFR